MKIAIVDDEINARMTMRLLIDRLAQGYEIVAEIESVAQAKEVLPRTNPDILLLDIELIDGTGFEILENYNVENMNVVFTTAYHQHAIKAFKNNAVDYLLKPIDLDELKEALAKCKSNSTNSFNYNSLVKKIIKDINGPKIQIHSTEAIEFVYTKEIIHLKADGVYSDIHLTKDRKVNSSKPLKHYEQKLDPQNFFRINRFEMVNLEHIVKFKKNEGHGVVVMNNGIEINVSRRKKLSFKDWIKDVSDIS